MKDAKNLRAARKEEIETFISEILDIEHKVYVILNYLKNINDLTSRGMKTSMILCFSLKVFILAGKFPMFGLEKSIK